MTFPTKKLVDKSNDLQEQIENKKIEALPAKIKTQIMNPIINFYDSGWLNTASIDISPNTSGVPNVFMPQRLSISHEFDFSLPEYLLPFLEPTIVLKSKDGKQVATGIYVYEADKTADWVKVYGDGVLLLSAMHVTSYYTPEENSWRKYFLIEEEGITWDYIKYKKEVYAIDIEFRYTDGETYRVVGLPLREIEGFSGSGRNKFKDSGYIQGIDSVGSAGHGYGTGLPNYSFYGPYEYDIWGRLEVTNLFSVSMITFRGVSGDKWGVRTKTTGTFNLNNCILSGLTTTTKFEKYNKNTKTWEGISYAHPAFNGGGGGVVDLGSNCTILSSKKYLWAYIACWMQDEGKSYYGITLQRTTPLIPSTEPLIPTFFNFAFYFTAQESIPDDPNQWYYIAPCGGLFYIKHHYIPISLGVPDYDLPQIPYSSIRTTLNEGEYPKIVRDIPPKEPNNSNYLGLSMWPTKTKWLAIGNQNKYILRKRNTSTIPEYIINLDATVITESLVVKDTTSTSAYVIDISGKVAYFPDYVHMIPDENGDPVPSLDSYQYYYLSTYPASYSTKQITMYKPTPQDYEYKIKADIINPFYYRAELKPKIT
jgi:hypothetical protein